LSQREPLFRVANRLGERRWLQQKAREAPGGIRRSSARTVASIVPAQLAIPNCGRRLASLTARCPGGLGFRNDRALPLGRRNHSAVQPQFAGEAGTGKEHRELRSPEAAPARYSLSKSSGKETATDAAQRLLDRDRRQSGRFRRDDQSGAHHRRNDAQNARSQHRQLVLAGRAGTTIQEGKSACCT
jgi:hypothetical protein